MSDDSFSDGMGSDDEFDEYEDNDEYYATFNLSKNATQEEIRARYLQLSQMYHPDKLQQQGKTGKQLERATELFRRINEAYEVLSNAEKRARYDSFGKAGLNLQIGPHLRTPEEIKEALRQKKEDMIKKRRQMETNASGTVTLKVDAKDVVANKRYIPEVTQIALKQSYQTPLSSRDTLVLQGASSAQQFTKDGRANFVATLSHTFSAATSTEFSAVLDRQTIFLLNTKRNFSSTSGASLNWIFVPSALALGFELSAHRALSEHTTGEIKWSFPIGSSVHANFTTVRPDSGITHSYGIEAASTTTVKYSINKRIPDSAISFHAGAKAMYSLEQGPSYEVDALAFQKLSPSNSVGIGLGAGTEGISVKLAFKRDQQMLSVPITLTDRFDMGVFLASTMIPTVVYTIAKIFVIAPYQRRKRRMEAETQRAQFREQCLKKRAEAMADQEFMEDAVARKRTEEERRNGLVIVNARYGNLHSDIPIDPECPPYLDVTVPLQNLVDKSKLQLHSYSKANLDGFYDPCPNEEKQLHILYLFKGKLHEVEVDDLDEVKIPQEEHLKKEDL